MRRRVFSRISKRLNNAIETHVAGLGHAFGRRRSGIDPLRRAAIAGHCLCGSFPDDQVITVLHAVSAAAARVEFQIKRSIASERCVGDRSWQALIQCQFRCGGLYRD